MSKVRKRQSKTITIAYASIAGIVLLVVAAIALVVLPPSPPSVSEFAPQAQEQIDHAPEQQSSQFGNGAGACAPGQICEEEQARALSTKQVIERARVKRCVGDPPRQTEDPQSPPCVNFWKGENGGATWKGVTRDEIRVAVGKGGTAARTQRFLAHFNSRYEFYGRSLRLVEYQPTSDGQAAAIAVSDTGAFAMGAYDAYNSLPPGFLEEIARRGLIVAPQVLTEDGDRLERLRPHVWGFRPPGEVAAHALGSLVCNSLANRSARFAGPEFISSPRKFGIVITKQQRLDPSPLLAEMSRCRVSAQIYEFDMNADQTQRQVQIAQLQADGITSVLFHADDRYLAYRANAITSNTMQNANEAGYHPEWIFSGMGHALELEFNFAADRSPADERGRLFGIFTTNKINPISDEPATWAVGEQSVEPQDVTYYRSLLMLASGFQMAGPNLTPSTFEQGLFRTRFPNPGAGGPPYYQARVGFPGRHTMVDDVGVVWWSDAAPSYRYSIAGDDGRGSWCYVDRGRRYDPKQIPDVESKLFLLDPGACR